jgi:hypothetical protein
MELVINPRDERRAARDALGAHLVTGHDEKRLGTSLLVARAAIPNQDVLHWY